MNENKIAVIGLGYVGLPLAIEFSKHFEVTGFDTDEERIEELKQAIDKSHEADITILKSVMSRTGKGLRFSSDAADIAACNIYIITVPTPINTFKAPDLSFLLKASEIVGKFRAVRRPVRGALRLPPHASRISRAANLLY